MMDTINAVDLSRRLPNNKTLDLTTGDIVIGTLTEWQRRVHWLVQKSLEPAEEIIQKVAEIMEMHMQSHREETTHDRQKFQARLERYHAELMVLTEPYVNFKNIFLNEVKLTFPDCDKNFPIIGVRDGRTLVGRHDDRRKDINNLDKLLLGTGGMHTLIELELSIQKVDSELPESHTRN